MRNPKLGIKLDYKNRWLISLSIILSFIVLSIFCFILLVNKQTLFSGTDLLFHIKRILELKASFNHGNLPKYSFNQFHGSAVMMLYPYINFIPLLFLSLIIKSNIILIYIWLSLNVFLSLVISYFSSKYFSKSILTSYVFAIVYSLSNVFMSYLFYDSDYGVVTVIAVLPLIVFGFLHLLSDGSIIELVTGILFIIFSHVLSVFIIIGFLILWLLINYTKLTHKLMKSIFKCMLIVSLISSIEWLPAVYFSMNNLHSIKSLSFSYLRGTKFNLLLEGSLITHITYGLSMFAIIGLILSILFYKKFNSYVKQMFWLSILFVFICSTLFPWTLFHYKIFKIVKIFQFSWRFYIIPQVLLCYIFAEIITNCIKYKKLCRELSAFSIVIMIISQFCYQKEILHINLNSPTVTSSYINNDNNRHRLFNVKYTNYLPKSSYKFTNYKQMKNLYNIDGNGFPYFSDYYPKESKNGLIDINNNLAINNTDNHIYFAHDGYNTFKFYNRYNSKKLIIPIFKYKNEKLKINLNHKLVPAHSKHGMIYLNNVNKGKNIIHIKSISNVAIKYMSLSMLSIGLLWYIFKLKIWIQYKIK